MAIYLVQHGLAVSKEVDAKRPLSGEGREQVSHVAQHAKNCDLTLHCIAHSGKLRAKQTAEVFEQFLLPSQGLKTLEGLGPNEDVMAFAQSAAFREQTMVVGHLPFLGKLAAWMTTGTIETQPIQLYNGGIVCLKQETSSNLWRVHWVLTPEIVNG